LQYGGDCSHAVMVMNLMMMVISMSKNLDNGLLKFNIWKKCLKGELTILFLICLISRLRKVLLLLFHGVAIGQK
jgi:hypothetical protein